MGTRGGGKHLRRGRATLNHLDLLCAALVEALWLLYLLVALLQAD